QRNQYLAILTLALAAACAPATVTPTSDAPRPAAFTWPQSSPAQEGLDTVPIAQLAARIRAGGFGNVDRLVVVRNGRLATDERFARDYSAISRGASSALGCGAGTCTDSAAQVHQYNYLHPRFHPWYEG